MYSFWSTMYFESFFNMSLIFYSHYVFCTLGFLRLVLIVDMIYIKPQLAYIYLYSSLDLA